VNALDYFAVSDVSGEGLAPHLTFVDLATRNRVAAPDSRKYRYEVFVDGDRVDGGSIDGATPAGDTDRENGARVTVPLPGVARGILEIQVQNRLVGSDDWARPVSVFIEAGSPWRVVAVARSD
jgi:hypothetical protein